MNDVPQTEQVNPRTHDLDELSSLQLANVLIDEQYLAAAAVVAAADTIAKAIDEISARMRAGGRLHYVGAGTSGRLGFLDASEMPPTFGTDPSLVCAHIAGGLGALTIAVEGAEDDADAGAAEMRGHVKSGDAVVGISASGTAPYVLGAIEQARKLNAWTLGVANSPGSALVLGGTSRDRARNRPRAAYGVDAPQGRHRSKDFAQYALDGGDGAAWEKCTTTSWWTWSLQIRNCATARCVW